jgi:hypothetical protein
MTEFEEEKFSLILQINELYQIIDLTQQNLTNAIHQVTKRRKKIFVSNYNFMFSYQTKINNYKSK